jgi:hypothetical protein
MLLILVYFCLPRSDDVLESAYEAREKASNNVKRQL